MICLPGDVEVSQYQVYTPQLSASFGFVFFRRQLKSSADNCRHNSLLQDSRGSPYLRPAKQNWNQNQEKLEGKLGNDTWPNKFQGNRSVKGGGP